MEKILVTYATNAGSSAKIAEAIAGEIAQRAPVEILPLEKVAALEGYTAVVLGAPMILGWHRKALAFLRHNRAALSRVPLAIFVTCMNLTRTGETSLEGIPLFVDEKLPLTPRRAGRLSLKERYALPRNYLKPILKAAGTARPVSVAIFGGSLQYFNLKWWAAILALLIIRAQPGDRRNWEAVSAWAGGLFKKG